MLPSSKRANGRVVSNFSKEIFIIAVIGAAINTPITPHNIPQNIRDKIIDLSKIKKRIRSYFLCPIKNKKEIFPGVKMEKKVLKKLPAKHRGKKSTKG